LVRLSDQGSPAYRVERCDWEGSGDRSTMTDTTDGLEGLTWRQIMSIVSEGNDLTRGQATWAMTQILEGTSPDTVIAGLIVALRIKGETVEEMTGMVTAMLERASTVAVSDDTIDIVGTGGSPHRRNHALNVSTMATILAGAAGAKVCKHGNRKASSTSGSFDFLDALGITGEIGVDQLAKMMDKTGVGFAFARMLHPAMRFAGPARIELGIPTVFNILGPLANPCRVRRQLVGTPQPSIAAKMAAVLQNLGSIKSWVVSGNDGLDELSITGPSTVFEVSPDRITEFQISPADAGLPQAASLDDIVGGDAEANVRIFSEILSGAETGPKRDIVVMNAAAGLIVAGLTDRLESGVEEILNVIEDGRGAAKLAELAAF